MFNNITMIYLGLATAIAVYFLVIGLAFLFMKFRNRRKKKPPQDHYFAERKKDEDN
jgi:hypothetical protein